MSSNEGDLVFPPIGGSGITYIKVEILKRICLGIEIGSTEFIKYRFDEIQK